jgi:hypothetical protein
MIIISSFIVMTRLIIVSKDIEVMKIISMVGFQIRIRTSAQLGSNRIMEDSMGQKGYGRVEEVCQRYCWFALMEGVDCFWVIQMGFWLLACINSSCQ